MDSDYEPFCFGLFYRRKRPNNQPLLYMAEDASTAIQRFREKARASRTRAAQYEFSQKENAAEAKRYRREGNEPVALSHMRMSIINRESLVAERMRYENLCGMITTIEHAKRNHSAVLDMFRSNKTVEDILRDTPDAGVVIEQFKEQYERVKRDGDELAQPMGGSGKRVIEDERVREELDRLFEEQLPAPPAAVQPRPAAPQAQQAVAL